MNRQISAILVALALSSCATRDAYVSRVETLALIQSLNAQILSSTSATLTLERWCADHAMASEPKIVAVRPPSEVKVPAAEQLQRLGVSSAGQVRYRRVELRCGAHVFSEADNWYVPERLTQEMNQLLDTTDTPFGKVVRPLQPYRRTIEANLLWSPLPDGWETNRACPGCNTPPQLPRTLFQHRAVLYTSAHEPFSEVVEVYRSDLLAFR